MDSLKFFCTFVAMDSLQHQGRRRQLIAALAQQYPFHPKVLEAMERVPRHLFIERGLDHLAYLDKPLPIGANQTISQPFTVAMQSHLLAVNKWDRVLEIGTGCGYQTAVLLEMGLRVFSIERHKSLYLSAQQLLQSLGYSSVHLHYGDGFKGLPQFAPFKGILVSCGAPQVPEALQAQLALGGHMVVPLGLTEQTMTVLTRNDETSFTQQSHGIYSFVPMLEGIQ